MVDVADRPAPGALEPAPLSDAASGVRLPAGHPVVAVPRIGVLLVNLGTPDAPTPAAVRRYLKEFLSDRRVVDYPRALWLPLLHGIILNVRPSRSARAYASIWRTDGNGSPLRYYTKASAEGLAARFKSDRALAEKLIIDFAMRYGQPSIDSRIKALKAAGCQRILVVPLYPQYSVTTTASVHDAVHAAIGAEIWQPALRMAAPFHDDPLYIEALAASAAASLASLDWNPERVVLSFHGVPARYLEAGDPYHCHCAKTARLLRERMGWSEAFAPLTFQSRFGPEPWLEPATSDTITALAKEGVKRVAVMTPGFTADCLETLEEIGMEAHEAFLADGGETFAAMPCLNDSDGMLALLEAIVRREAAGWL